MPKQKEHPAERLVRLAVEAAQSDIKRFTEYMTVTTGRPAFHKKLSDDERLDRFLVPEIREQLLSRMDDKEREEYLQDMYHLLAQRSKKEGL